MTAEEVAEATGLDRESAGLAKRREYDETLTLDGTGEETNRALAEIEQAGLNYTHSGRFYGVMGANDKGKATVILSDLYRRLWGEIKTVGLGDSLNDLPMLSAVDIPVLVQKGDNNWEDMALQRLRKIRGIGPEGWNRAVEEILRTNIN